MCAAPFHKVVVAHRTEYTSRAHTTPCLTSKRWLAECAWPYESHNSSPDLASTGGCFYEWQYSGARAITITHYRILPAQIFSKLVFQKVNVPIQPTTAPVLLSSCICLSRVYANLPRLCGVVFPSGVWRTRCVFSFFLWGYHQRAARAKFARNKLALSEVAKSNPKTHVSYRCYVVPLCVPYS